MHAGVFQADILHIRRTTGRRQYILEMLGTLTAILLARNEFNLLANHLGGDDACIQP
ncbi:hypothetical protein D3C81_1988510 [compost metagenome]